jgi:glycosyltransferase involved in cell wall biosynthesis
VPKVSVIIPAYNAEKTLLGTIASLQQQTFTDFELIIINDGSTDGTLALLETLTEPRLRIYSDANGGLPVARNRGIARATGEYLAFIDADDLWTPDKLADQVQALVDCPEAGVAYSWTAFIDAQNQYLYAKTPKTFTGQVYTRLLVENFIASGSNILVRRSVAAAVGLFDPSLKSAEDWDYYIRLAAFAPFVLVPKYQILYRRSPQSMSANVAVMEQNGLRVIDRAFAQAPATLQYLKRHSLAHTYRFYALLHLENAASSNATPGSVAQATHKLKQAILAQPKIIGDRLTQRLLIKIILLNLFPYDWATRCSSFLARVFPSPTTKPVLPTDNAASESTVPPPPSL